MVASKRTRKPTIAEIKATRDKAIQDAGTEMAVELFRMAQAGAKNALKKLARVVDGDEGVGRKNTMHGSEVDGSYVAALRLAVQAGGVLTQKVDVTSGGDKVQSVNVVRCSDAPGTLQPMPDDE